MAGYNWSAGKSNNAVAAENNGLMVASQLAADLRADGLKGCTAADVAAVLTPAEWHHSSKFFNRVNYYEGPSDREVSELTSHIKARKLFAKLLKQAYGKFTVKLISADGAVTDWHTVEKHELSQLGRMLATVKFGGLSEDWTTRESQEAEALADHGLVAKMYGGFLSLEETHA